MRTTFCTLVEMTILNTLRTLVRQAPLQSEVACHILIVDGRVEGPYFLQGDGGHMAVGRRAGV